MKKVLIIDDEKDYCFFIKQNLELDPEFNVLIATSGREGFVAAARNKPDLILLDIMMPHMNGFEVLRELKIGKQTAAIPVIMLSALDAEDNKKKAFGLYDEYYIVKPVDVDTLKEKIHSVIARTKV